jgi:membrane fusion protein (multidrug efflux system)
LKHKKAVMAGGIVVVCLLLAGVRWFVSYAPEKAPANRSGASAGPDTGGGSAPSVRAFVCKRGSFVDNLVLTGTLQGGARVELRFNREGKISRIAKRVGETVKKGDIIAELDTGEANIKLQQAESELSQAVEMYRAGAVAKPRLMQAQLAAQLAREEFSRSYIRAPRAGSIGELNAEAGEYVNTQMTVASLVSVDTVFVEMGVIEKDLSKLTLGQTVKLEVESYPGVVFEGKITNISPIVEGTSRTRSVKAEIPNPKGALLPGMFARTKIFVMQKPDALVVPATALRIVDKTPTVYTIVSNKAKATPVKVGYESVDYSEIVSGLSEGDRVVAQVTDQIRDGAHVEVVEETGYADK